MISWLVLIVVTVMIIVASVVKYRESERRAVLQVLAIAAERGVPLSSVARYLGTETASHRGTRLLQLAESLEEGMPLAAALAVPPKVLSYDDLLAAEFGEEAGMLGEAMTEAAGRNDLLKVRLRSMLEKLFYIALVAFWASAVASFMMIKIVPTFAELFEGFDLDLPGITRLIIEAANSLRLFVLLLTQVFFLLICLGVGFYIGAIPRSFPILRWWSIRVDGANLKRMLAVAVRQQRPIVATLRWLAERYPLSNIRAKLTKAVAEMEHGHHWCDCLCNVGLMKWADAAVLQAAERVGNLPWALEEMADSTLRRMTYRVTAVTNILFPLCIIGIGLCVFVFAVGMLLPLFDLTGWLAL